MLKLLIQEEDKAKNDKKLGNNMKKNEAYHDEYLFLTTAMITE